MDLEELRSYCLYKKNVTESLPFGPDTLVFKVGEKMFLLTGVDDEELSFNVKCDPEYAIELREKYDFVLPGYHQNKKHWNTVHYNGSNTKILKNLIDHSYELVIASMPKKMRESLA